MSQTMTPPTPSQRCREANGPLTPRKALQKAVKNSHTTTTSAASSEANTCGADVQPTSDYQSGLSGVTSSSGAAEQGSATSSSSTRGMSTRFAAKEARRKMLQNPETS